jgi:hypothetical protein
MMTDESVEDLMQQYDALKMCEVASNGRRSVVLPTSTILSLVSNVEKVVQHPVVKTVCANANLLHQLEATLSHESQQKFRAGLFFLHSFKKIMADEYYLSDDDLVHTRGKSINSLTHSLMV